MSGTLWGIGVGPGDPELVTRKAWRLIREARVIACPSSGNGRSLARSIVAEAIRADCVEIDMAIPMATDREPAQAAYDEAAGKIASFLNKGEDVVVLCEGDPLFFGSFMYLHTRLAQRHPCKIVPGISSVMAAAAALGQPLAARTDVLTVIPATLDDDSIRNHIEKASSIAILKLGRHMPRIRQLVGQMGLTEHTHYAEKVSQTGETCARLSDAPDKPPYFSMLLINKGTDPWLS